MNFSRTLFLMLVLFGCASLSGLRAQNTPIAQNDDNFGYEGTTLSGNVGLNDSDPNGDPLTFSLVTGPTSGTFTFSPNGDYVYVPLPEFNGYIDVIYSVCDPSGNCAQATLELALAFVNDPPVIVNDEFYLNQNSVLNNTVATNDYDVDIEPIFFTLVTPPLLGTVTLNYTTGNFTYTPPTGFIGDVSFVYQGCDPCGACNNATVTIHVITPNFPPVTQDDSFFMYEDGSPITGSVATNDSDPDNDPLTFAISDLPEYGTATVSSNGSIVYSPPANYFGTTSFTYVACDPYQNCTIGYVSIEVSSVNDPPVANNDYFSGNENTVITGNVAANDVDIDDPWDNYFIDTPPLHGTLTLTNAGLITYTPVNGFFGADSAVYNMIDPCGANDYATIYFNVIAVNDAPIATNDSFTTSEDQVLNGNVALNDSDPNGDALSYALISSAAGGTFNLDNMGNFIFSPNLNFNGVYNAIYRVTDPFGASDTSFVVIQVLAVNDAPLAQGETFNMPEGAILNGNLSLNDSDPDGDVLVYSVVTQPSSGVLNLGANGVFSYSPPNNYSGIQTFTYQVSDGLISVNATVVITVFGVNSNPVAQDDSFVLQEDVIFDGDVSINDSDPDGDQLSWTILQMPLHGTLEMQQFTGAFTYTPESNFNGQDGFQYRVDDGFGGMSSATVLLNIQAVNDPPVAAGDAIVCNEDGSVASELLPLVMDVDNTVFSFSILTVPNHGQILLNNDGTYSYIPVNNYNGPDAFVYQVNDGAGGIASATVTITVAPVNDLPVLMPDQFTTAENTAIINTVASNDMDIDGDVIHYTLINAPSLGIVSLSDNGDFVYTPNAQSFGNDSFTLQGSDGNGGVANSTVLITITEVNNAPVSVDDSFEGMEDQTIQGDVSLNDSDVDDTELSFGLITQALHGYVVFASNGQFIYTPAANWNGTDSFRYYVADPSGLRDTSVVSLLVNAVNDAPNVAGENFGVLMNQSLSSVVSSNDTDPDGDNLIFSIVTQPLHGSIVFNSNGSFIYTPNTNYFGSDSFSYQACDTGGLCGSGTASIVITENNHPPVVLDETFVVQEDAGAINFDASANDSDPDGNPLIYALVENVSVGSGTLSSDGHYLFLAPVNYFGTQQVVYQVCDLFGDCTQGTLTIVVESVNDAPVASNAIISSFEDLTVSGTLQDYASDVDNDVLSFTILSQPSHGMITTQSAGQFTYVPAPNYYGSDQAIYQVCDPFGGCDTASIQISIAPQNDAPTAVDTTISVVSGQAFISSLATITNDVDSNILSYAVLNEPAHGMLDLLNNGTYTYTAFENFAGVDSFTFNVCDPLLWCATSTVFINVVPFNHPPVAGDQILTMCQNETASIPLIPLIADQDQSSNTLQLSALSATSGVVFFDTNTMTISFQPNTAFEGTATVDYTICDSGQPSQCASGTITIQVNTFQQVVINNAVVHAVSCHGESDGYVVIDAVGIGNLSYVWSGDANPAALSAGTYSVTILDDGLCSAPVTASFTIEEPDSIVVTDFTEETISSGTYMVQGGTPPFNFMWQSSTGQVVSTNQAFLGVGLYTLTITDDNQCTWQTEIGLGVSVQEGITERMFDIFPNPGRDAFNLKFSSQRERQLTLKIVDARGGIVAQRNILAAQGTNVIGVDMTAYAAGTYIVMVMDGESFKSIYWTKQ